MDQLLGSTPSEYGLEIALTLGSLVTSLNLSIDQARELLRFFCYWNFRLRKPTCS